MPTMRPSAAPSEAAALAVGAGVDDDDDDEVDFFDDDDDDDDDDDGEGEGGQDRRTISPLLQLDTGVVNEQALSVASDPAHPTSLATNLPEKMPVYAGLNWL
mmetsp:Transcript_46423/g.107156  ORF Transcript_46423/g.107156 Transcript_46423/m.107156 type:complete len:102 (+) Transcript_46423:270-575(+)